jgi:hypothetical protein
MTKRETSRKIKHFLPPEITGKRPVSFKKDIDVRIRAGYAK